MKIELNEKSDRNFYDELLYIINFNQRIRKKPTKRISTMTKELTRLIILSIAILIVSTTLFISYNDKVMLLLTIIVFLILILLVYYLLNISKMINTYLCNESTSTININNSGIELINNHQKMKMNWNMVSEVLINKYSIYLMPTNLNDVSIALSTKNKDKFLVAMKKYKKDDLIIDNTNK